MENNIGVSISAKGSHLLCLLKLDVFGASSQNRTHLHAHRKKKQLEFDAQLIQIAPHW